MLNARPNEVVVIGCSVAGVTTVPTVTNDTTWPISFHEVKAASERLRPYLASTPLRSYSELDNLLGIHVLVKHENHNPTNCFKIRNALSTLSALSQQEKSRGVVAATSGNHGYGLAFAGKLLGVPITICVPHNNNPDKNAAILSLGAELLEVGSDYDEAVVKSGELAQERGLYLIHSTNNRNIIAGAATLTLEMLSQAKQSGEFIDAIVVAIGGGSQAVGALTVLRELKPGIAVYGVQAEQAGAIHASWKARKQLHFPRPQTFADGLATRTPYDMTFPALQAGLADFLTVSEREIAEAVRMVIRITHNLVEGAGAVGLAGVRKLASHLKDKYGPQPRVAIILSGSNIDQATLSRVLLYEL